MRVRVTHSIDGLARDLSSIATTAKPKMTGVVRRNTQQGTALTRQIARGAAGIHGSNYFKRISGEMIGPLSGEYGPEGVVAGNAVGAGWRHGAGNTDLEKSLDIQGPKFAKDVGDLADGLFWP